MDYKQLFSDIFTLNGKSLHLRFCKLMAIIKRSLILPFKKNFGNGKDIRKIPVIINNRNRYTYLLQLINWLENNGYSNIYIIDNNSTYPKLLEYYSSTKYTVFRLKENVGNYSLWKTDIYKQFISDYYIYTDPDVVPVDECPGNVIEVFLGILNSHRLIEKIGFGLKIDDLPDYFADKHKVLEWEKKFWEKPVEKDLYDADIDTTFALYRPYSNMGIWVPKAYRTGGKFMARHLPWYENTASLSEENIYYQNHVRTGISHWTPSPPVNYSNR